MTIVGLTEEEMAERLKREAKGKAEVEAEKTVNPPKAKKTKGGKGA